MKNFESLLTLPTPCQKLPDENLFGMPLWIKRDDLIHPVVSGNKYRKLKYPLLAVAEQAKQSGLTPTLVTMGGIWSNHVHASAYAAAELGYRSHALIRGHVGMDSAMLQDCRARGMTIQFVDRASYRQLREKNDCWQTLVKPDSAQVWLPEGGSAPSALHGVAELIAELPFVPDVMMVACGSGATLAGLLAGLQGRGHVIGIAVLENADYLRVEVSRLLRQAGYPDYQNFQLLTEFHHGGYAKVSSALQQFCGDFIHHYQVPIEPVYTGKMFFALKSLIEAGNIRCNETVICLHTGGLQGARGMPDFAK
jgi:1-aminocyclopropane-1-carboxylate deaminase